MIPLPDERMIFTVTDPLLRIRVVYISSHTSWDQWYSLPQGVTLGQALEQSGLYTALRTELADEGALDELQVGVWGQISTPELILQDKDRVEVYRSLTFDPMESRRRRYAHKRSQKPPRPRRQPRATVSL